MNNGWEIRADIRTDPVYLPGIQSPPMTFADSLKALLATQTPLIRVITREEERFIETLQGLRGGIETLGITAWDFADGFTTLRRGKAEFPHADVTSETIVRHIADKMPGNHILVLKDFQNTWNNLKYRSLVTRKLRNLAPKLRGSAKSLIMVTPPLPEGEDLPPELKPDTVSLEMPLPDYADLARVVDGFTSELPGRDRPSEDLRHKLIESALGLRAPEAKRALAMAWIAYGRLDERAVGSITEQKQEIIRQSGALEFWPASAGEGDVGGLDQLKSWLKKRELGFSAEARTSGLPYPKGVALIGIPGTGKSLSAKMLSGLWKLPLLRLDVGALFGALLGESESNLRHALQLAETISPCILWVDEMEKAFAGGALGAGNQGAGAATRVFGTFLTWMQEHAKPVFVIATANEIESLPPELMGRFDRTYFLDLPNAVERKAIFAIHLKNAQVDFPERKFAMPALVEASRGMVGREIARAVIEAQFTAFANGNREIEQKDLLEALAEVVPLSKSHEKVIDGLRVWLTEGRARTASSPEPLGTAVRAGRQIEVD